jgi:hypothetical protein
MITDEMRKHKNLIKYKVDNFDILFQNGDVEKMSGDMVTHLYIEKDYDDLYFPIINLSVSIKDEIYHRIKQENDTVKFRLRVIKNIYDQDMKFLKYELAFNEVFQCFKDKDNTIEDNEANESKKKTEGDAMTGMNTRDFYLFTEDVSNCKKFFNLSVESASLSDLLIYILNQSGVNKLLMSKLNNNISLSNVTIPSGNTIDTINYLNNLKSLYEKGMLLFFDIDTTYLIDKNYKCTAWRKNEIRVTHIHISNQQSNDSQMNGFFINKDRKQTHVFTNTGRVQIRNVNVMSNQLNGNNIKIIDTKANSSQSVSASTTTIGNANDHLLTVKTGNKYAVSDLKTRLEENECVCGVVLLGVDIEVISPNKEIFLTYDDSKLNKQYGGNYRISKMVATLSKDAEELVGEIQVVLKKQK